MVSSIMLRYRLLYWHTGCENGVMVETQTKLKYKHSEPNSQGLRKNKKPNFSLPYKLYGVGKNEISLFPTSICYIGVKRKQDFNCFFPTPTNSQ